VAAHGAADRPANHRVIGDRVIGDRIIGDRVIGELQRRSDHRRSNDRIIDRETASGSRRTAVNANVFRSPA
jgi:hypothetical protein